MGFPLRDLTPTGPLPGLPPGPGPVFLVMGGSQSSSAVNSLARDALIRLHRAGRTLRVIHLAGPQEQEIRDAYRAAGVPATVFGYLHDMGAAYTAATAAIARAGAGSCAELAAFGVPALYIPYPLAGDHQRYNARAMEKAGAAITRLQSTLTVDGLADRIGHSKMPKLSSVFMLIGGALLLLVRSVSAVYVGYSIAYAGSILYSVSSSANIIRYAPDEKLPIYVSINAVLSLAAQTLCSLLFSAFVSTSASFFAIFSAMFLLGTVSATGYFLFFREGCTRT